MLLRLRNAGSLLRDLGGYAFANEAFWLLPLFLLLALAGAVISVGQVAAPYTIYTVF